MASSAFPAMVPGLVLNERYTLVGFLARGGMAEVWEGRDLILDRSVAVKILQPQLARDAAVRERFRREAVIAARLSHPGVVTTYDTGIDGAVAYIVMELVRGSTLRELISESGYIRPSLAVQIAKQVSEALVLAHRNGLVHRDLKPANILVSQEDDGKLRAKVTDFGIAKVTQGVEHALTRTGVVLGTPKYLSPEQVLGMEPDGRADLYSLGVVLFEMLTGRPPFQEATDMATAMARLRSAAPRVRSIQPSVPPALDALVADLLAKDLSARVRSAGALCARLDGVLRAELGGDIADSLREPKVDSSQANTDARATRATSRTDLASKGGHVNWGPPSSAVAHTSPEPARTSASEGRRRGYPDALGASVGAPASAERFTGKWPRVRDTALAGTAVMPPQVGARLPDKSGSGSGSPRRPPRPPRTRPRTRRRGPGLVVACLSVAAVLIVALLLHGGHDSKRSGTSTTGASGMTGSATQPIVHVGVFMNNFRSPDNPSQTGLTFDSNPRSAWSTDLYTTARFGGLYSGEGLAIELAHTARLRSLVVTSPTRGWSASTYVSTTDLPTGSPVSAWGRPTDHLSNIDGSATFSLRGRRGNWVLLWLTKLGPTANGSYAASVGNLRVV